MNNSGFNNENQIIFALDNKYLHELNDNLQRLIKGTFKNYNQLILCKKLGVVDKSDIQITIGDESHTFSIKKGTGNSVHQEPIEAFIKFLSDNYQITKKTADYIRLFIWGDRTLDGTGQVQDRISAPEFKKIYPNIILDIQSFFNTIKEDLIKRFLLTGASFTNSAEFIYYGDINNGIFSRAQYIIPWVINNESKGAISIGKLTFQAWNRNINGGHLSENKRGVIQLKWGTLKKDIHRINNE